MNFAAIRRKLLAKPGITAQPTCEFCLRETEARHLDKYGFCEKCRAERAEASAWFQQQIDASDSTAPGVFVSRQTAPQQESER